MKISTPFASMFLFFEKDLITEYRQSEETHFTVYN